MYFGIFSDRALNSRDFLFRCIDCGTILEANFEEDKDINKIQSKKMYVECPCGGVCKVLFD